MVHNYISVVHCKYSDYACLNKQFFIYVRTIIFILFKKRIEWKSNIFLWMRQQECKPISFI